MAESKWHTQVFEWTVRWQRKRGTRYQSMKGSCQATREKGLEEHGRTRIGNWKFNSGIYTKLLKQTPYRQLNIQ